ncbi:MAG: hypothetical protein QXY90_06735 [Candidatus Anstonellales archaeon]
MGKKVIAQYHIKRDRLDELKGQLLLGKAEQFILGIGDKILYLTLNLRI